jgi:hypothetical protein
MDKSSTQINTPMPIFFFVLVEAIRGFVGRLSGSAEQRLDDGGARMW